MSYSCTYDQTLDNLVVGGLPCTSLPNSVVSFNSSTGLLVWTPDEVSSILGNYEFKISGKNETSETNVIFNVGVRLKFLGITEVTNVTGVSANVKWTPNANAAAYQVYIQNNITGLFELSTTVAGGNVSNTTITSLQPNLNYTVRVNAVDSQGHIDRNTNTISFVTTELVKLALTSSSSTGIAGTPVTITVQAYTE